MSCKKLFAFLTIYIYMNGCEVKWTNLRTLIWLQWIQNVCKSASKVKTNCQEWKIHIYLHACLVERYTWVLLCLLLRICIWLHTIYSSVCVSGVYGVYVCVSGVYIWRIRMCVCRIWRIRMCSLTIHSMRKVRLRLQSMLRERLFETP